MFWAKIWMFFITVAAVVALAIAVVIPRPAERATRKNEISHLNNACRTGQIILRNDARQRVQKTAEIANKLSVAGHTPALVKSGAAASVPAESRARGKEALNVLSFGTGKEPDFILLLDKQGRIVSSRGNWKQKTEGANLKGFFVVDDALAGYMRDDLWSLKTGLYRVAAAPILTQAPFSYAGAIVIGQSVGPEFVKNLQTQLGVEVGFYADKKTLATSSTASIDRGITKDFASKSETNAPLSCNQAFAVEVDEENVYDVVSMQLPGEAGVLGAFISVFSARDMKLGFAGSFSAIKKSDLSFGNFPWIALALSLMVLLAGGMFLIWFEVDKPLKKLALNAVQLAQGESARFDELQHKQKTGSIARSVNIALERLQRDAKDAKKDLDGLLGPMPNVPAQGTQSSIQDPLPPPPPSDFQFSVPAASNASLTTNSNTPPIDIPAIPKAPAPPPGIIPAKPDKKAATLQPQTDTRVAPKPISLGNSGASKGGFDEDILGMPTDSEATIVSAKSAKIAADSENVYFKEVFDEFISVKKKCGEDTANLRFEKFAGKLSANRDALISKHGCTGVRFQVYVKDGKAALKASPIKG